MKVTAPGSIGFDFRSECAGWLEFDSRVSPRQPPPQAADDQADDQAAVEFLTASVAMSTSEFDLPQFTTPTGGNNRGNCTAAAQPVPGVPGRYRLVINSELYEGLRYGWLHVQTTGASPPAFTVTNFTAVCQAIPINYADHAFEASGAAVPAGAEPGAGSFALEEVWYTAMYTTRVRDSLWLDLQPRCGVKGRFFTHVVGVKGFNVRVCLDEVCFCSVGMRLKLAAWVLM